MRTSSVAMLAGITLTGLSGCSLAPHYDRPAAPVAAQWSAPVQTEADAKLHWRSLFTDPRLQQTIDLALANNRDLRVAALNIQQARAQYGIQRAGLLPALDGGLSGTKSHTDASGDNETWNANLGLSWQLDLFGRIRSLDKAALESFFSAQENRNAVAIALIGSTADAWLGLAADQDLLTVTQQTYTIRQDAYDIAVGKARIGVLSDLDLSQAKTLMEQARADVAQAQTQIDQDKSALTLLTGASVSDDLLPTSLGDTVVADTLPIGLPSDVLLNRPDVLSAEHGLKAANADIGAARAAFFPSISLTGALGSASGALGDLFKSGNGTWSYGGNASVPIFAGGANINNLRGAKAGRDIAVAQYEGAIQSAFNDVNQALAVRARIDERLDALTQANDAAQTSLRLSQARYDNGTDSYLTLLDAQRTAYASQQQLIGLRALKATNLVALYQALGDDDSLN